MKISDFLKEKLNNFHNFIDEQLNKTNIDQLKKVSISNDLIKYKSDVNSFIQAMITLANYDLENSIKLFLLNYNIDINDIRDDIDYDKLKRYLEMFIDVVKK